LTQVIYNLPGGIKLLNKILTADPDLCTGCRTCELICSLNKEGECNPRKSRIRILKIETEGIDMPLICQHCAEPLCRDVCPVNALSRDIETGAIVLNEKVCIGCRACSMACPFGVIGYDYIKGVSRKCDLCGGEPKCVMFCETKALRYERPEYVETLGHQAVLQKFKQSIIKSTDNPR